MKRIHIIGGGLAGLSLGVALRQRNVPVTLSEAKPYPRHKVCGEFVSGHGLEVLDQLGFDPWKIGIPVETISFHHRSRNSSSQRLPERGAGLRRYDLDAALAKRFVDLRGELRCPFRFQGERAMEGDVLATGRRLETAGKWKWYGLKAHMKNLEQQSDLELHFTDNGYVGLCRIGPNTSNVCGLFRRSKRRGTPACSFLEHFTSVSTLYDRLKNAIWDESSFASVSGLPIDQGGTPESDTFAVGDALSMVPPLTGNGMSVALESAACAAAPLAAYASGKFSWTEALSIYRRETRHLFERRMSTADSVQKILMNRVCKGLLMASVDFIPFWRPIFVATR